MEFSLYSLIFGISLYKQNVESRCLIISIQLDRRDLFNHLTIVCLLIDQFNPLTFKVTIDRTSHTIIIFLFPVCLIVILALFVFIMVFTFVDFIVMWFDLLLSFVHLSLVLCGYHGDYIKQHLVTPFYFKPMPIFQSHTRTLLFCFPPLL